MTTKRRKENVSLGKITATQKLIVEDFPDQKSWIGKMFSVVNDYFQKVQSTLNGQIEFSSNIMGIEVTLDFVYASHTVNLPIYTRWPLAKKPKSLHVASAYLGSHSGQGGTVYSNKNLVPFICGVSWAFGQDGNISINDFVWIDGAAGTIDQPIVGQRVQITVRITP